MLIGIRKYQIRFNYSSTFSSYWIAYVEDKNILLSSYMSVTEKFVKWHNHKRELFKIV